ncbi:cytosine permease [Gordonia iterans]
MTDAVVDEPTPAGFRVLGYEPFDRRAGLSEEESAQDQKSWWFFWTWLVTPHIEFGAVWVGLVVVYFMDVSLLQALIGLFLGTAFGAFTHGVLTATGVRLRVPQLELGRTAFGKKGNLIVTTVMSVISAYGWFIVNSLVAALAIAALFDFSTVWALLIVVVVQFVLAQTGISYRAIKRYLYPAVSVLLVIAGVFAFVEVDPATDPGSPWDINGLIAIVVVACIAWAYSIGWSPYATDYSAVHPKASSAKRSGVFAALGLFAATMFLMSVGAVAGVVVGDKSTDNPTADFTSFLPEWLKVLVLIGLIVSPIAGSIVTLKSARNVFRFPKLGLSPQASVLAGQLVMTVLAFFLGWAALGDLAANYEGFVMVLGVWIGPWLNVILVDQYIKRKTDVTSLLYADGLSVKWGLFSAAFGIVALVLLWALQVFDRGFLPHGGLAYAALGMLVGFYLAAIVYGAGLKRVIKEHEIEAGQIDPHHKKPHLHLIPHRS